MLSRSTFGMLHLRSPAVTASGEPPLEGAFDRQVEQWPDELVALVEERHRKAVAITGVDHPVDRVAAVEDVVDGEENRHSHHVLILDVEARDVRQVERSYEFCRIIVLRIMLVLVINAPGELCAGNV